MLSKLMKFFKNKSLPKEETYDKDLYDNIDINITAFGPFNIPVRTYKSHMIIPKLKEGRIKKINENGGFMKKCALEIFYKEFLPILLIVNIIMLFFYSQSPWIIKLLNEFLWIVLLGLKIYSDCGINKDDERSI